MYKKYKEIIEAYQEGKLSKKTVLESLKHIYLNNNLPEPKVREILQKIISISAKDTRLYSFLESILITSKQDGLSIAQSTLECVLTLLEYFPEKSEPINFWLKKRLTRSWPPYYIHIEKGSRTQMYQRLQLLFPFFKHKHFNFVGEHSALFRNYNISIECSLSDHDQLEIQHTHYFAPYTFTVTASKAHPIYRSDKKVTMFQLTQQPRFSYSGRFDLAKKLGKDNFRVFEDYIDKDYHYLKNKEILLFYKRKYKDHYFYEAYNYSLISHFIDYFTQNDLEFTMYYCNFSFKIYLAKPPFTIIFSGIEFDEYLNESNKIPLCPKKLSNKQKERSKITEYSEKEGKNEGRKRKEK
jgi:hypothetical protein